MKINVEELVQTYLTIRTQREIILKEYESKEEKTKDKSILGIKTRTFPDKKEWYKDGHLHRLDGPAIEWASGSEEWYKDGELHRLDGPAQEFTSGTKHWYQDGELHRLDGPAAEYHNGIYKWYHKGKLHRKDGPAIVWPDGKRWFKDGIEYTNKESFFDALTEEEKGLALFSEDFLNG
jgi:hypothetical protein